MALSRNLPSGAFENKSMEKNQQKIRKEAARDSKKEIVRKWHLIDAKDQYLGRFISQIIKFLRGKNKISFAPNVDAGDYVIIINADSIKISGNKNLQKMYHHFSGYPGGISSCNFRDLFAKDPEKVLKLAVWGMLPKNKLRAKFMKRLKIFRNSNHPYSDKLNN